MIGARVATRLLGVLSTSAAAYYTFLSPRSQVLGAFPFRGSDQGRAVALTFDDGPNEPFTSQIGDYLADQEISATFFQVGRCVERFPEVSRRLVAQGHVIANHSYSHAFLRCLTPGRQRAEVARTQAALQAVTGLRPALYRPPWLLRTPALLRLLSASGLRPVSGTFCHPWEVCQPDAERIARRVLASARPGSIVIFHDGFDARGGNREQTARAVPMVVAALRARGYSFLSVPDLLHVQAYQ